MHSEEQEKRRKIPVITQEKYNERFPTEWKICLNCGSRMEYPLLELTSSVTCYACGRTDTLQNYAAFLKWESINAIETMTLRQWIQGLLPSLIANQISKGNEQTAAFLTRKLILLVRL